MDYQFTITRRMLAIVIFLLALLLVLFFLLGLQFGRDWGDSNQKNNKESVTNIIKPLNDLEVMQPRPVKPASN